MRLIAFIITFVMALPICGMDISPTRAPGTGGTVWLSNPTATSLANLPGAIDEGKLQLEMSGARQFEIKDLDQLSFAAAYRYHRLTIALGLQQFGYRDFYAERTARLHVGYSLNDFHFNVSGSGLQIDFGAHYEELRAASIGLSAGWHHNKFYFAATLDNLNRPTLYERGPEVPMRSGVYAEYRSSDRLSTMIRLTTETDQDAQFGLGQALGLSNKAFITWGFSTAPTLYGAGLELVQKRARFNYSANYHTVLGLTHRFSIGFFFGGKRQSTPKAEEPVF